MYFTIRIYAYVLHIHMCANVYYEFLLCSCTFMFYTFVCMCVFVCYICIFVSCICAFMLVCCMQVNVRSVCVSPTVFLALRRYDFRFMIIFVILNVLPLSLNLQSKCALRFPVFWLRQSIESSIFQA